jgi:Methionyl-tRNA formyltransferase
LTASDDYEPGCIYQIGRNDMYVQTGKGALSLVEVQLQGKKRMDTGSFLRGCHVEEGSFFT